MLDNKNKKTFTSYAKYSGIGLQMLLIIGLGTFTGVELDSRFPNNHNLYTVFFSLGSVILAIYYVIKRILAISNEEKKVESQE